jgi:glycosyltransferase involved in cell wall biosynthesis
MVVERQAGEAPEISVVIPCLDEGRTIAACVTRAREAFQALGISGEVIVSDNGSTDGSAALAAEAGARVVSCSERGYGAALQTGFAAARGRYVVMGDGDASYDFALVSRFVERLRQGSSFVMGSRVRGIVEPGAIPALNRLLGTPVLTNLLNVLCGIRISDCNCGMRGLTREAYAAIGATSPGMEFASEMIVKAALAGIPIDEVAIDFFKDRRGRPSHLRPWRDGWRHLRLLIWYVRRSTP